MDLKQTSGQSVAFVGSSSTNFVSPYQRARFGEDFVMRVLYWFSLTLSFEVLELVG